MYSAYMFMFIALCEHSCTWYLLGRDRVLQDCLHCRYVIVPYHKYPNLLDVLFNFLKTEQTTGVRREVVRVLGLLGALDPYKHTQHQRNEKRSKMGTPISKPMDKKTQGTGQ